MTQNHSANGVNAPVPIVDFGRFLHGSKEEREETAYAVDQALQNEGFIYLANHGVPQEKVDECLAWSKRFFDLPYSEKMKAPHPPGHTHHRGFSGIGLEQASQKVYDRNAIAEIRATAPDLKESFESGNPLDPAQPNIWPPEDVLPGFRAFLEDFFTHCAALSHAVLRCLARALIAHAGARLPGGSDAAGEAFLSAQHSTSPFQLRILHYPAAEAGTLARDGPQKRISAHSDFGSITLLFQDGVGGLETEDPAPARKGVFRPVEPRPELVLVNVGDLLERWSNGRWKSTLHRVGPPPLKPGQADGLVESPARYSIPFFTAPNPDAVIEALPGCYGEGNPKKYESVTTEEYIDMRMSALY